jgi:hypothetical protein
MNLKPPKTVQLLSCCPSQAAATPPLSNKDEYQKGPGAPKEGGNHVQEQQSFSYILFRMMILLLEL